MTDPATTVAPPTPVLARLETFTALGVVAVLALLLAGLAWTRPTQATEDRTVTYQQSAAISYAADTAPDSTYGVAGLQSGETVVLDAVDELRLRVAYTLDAAELSSVEGTAEVDAVVAVAGGLRRTFPVAEASVDGPAVVVEGVLPLKDMRAYLLKSRTLLGEAGSAATATVTLTPMLTVSGTLRGRSLSTRFDPTVDLVLTDDTLAVVSETDEPVLEDAGVLNPSETGELGYVTEVPATLPLLVTDPSVGLVRVGALVVLLTCLVALAVLGRRLFGPRDRAGEAARLLSLHGSRIVSVTRLSLRDGPVAEVASFDDLLDLARRYDSMLMHAADETGDTFSVWDTGLTYRYRLARDVPRPDDPTAPRDETALVKGVGDRGGHDGRDPQGDDDRTGERPRTSPAR